jgi:hypothetical protein
MRKPKAPAAASSVTASGSGSAESDGGGLPRLRDGLELRADKTHCALLRDVEGFLASPHFKPAVMIGFREYLLERLKLIGK